MYTFSLQRLHHLLHIHRVPEHHQVRMDLAPQGLVEQVTQDEIGFDEPLVLLQHTGQAVLMRVGLPLADEE